MAGKFAPYLSFAQTFNADRDTAMVGPAVNHTRTFASIFFWGGARLN